MSTHESMRRIVELVDRVASASCTVLVTGESGTGKELIVAAIHDASPRAKASLVAVNCGAIPENLIESELFGHARGAFTGATSARRGLVAAAEGGTLFLDEVGELPPNAQVKLLRLLQAREYTPVGESRPVHADVRVVAATHRDLASDVKAGRFREDLYYRLDVIRVAVPALRERASDIIPLATHFVDSVTARLGLTDEKRLTPAAIARLVAEPWPGNVRALENAIERAVLLTAGAEIGAEDIVPSKVPAASLVEPEAQPPTTIDDVAEHDLPMPSDEEPAAAIVDLRASVEAFENKLIADALARARNNKTRAAQMLGLRRTTLIEMMKRKGIESKRAA
ncbi:MAG: sigma-54-dependent Fis family transcriptional regulator [Deltaproteobacteria bacterium]|nr:sigma-54-dependent Fis family transcriptional regulator [Deltaproteobacteria bacterium]